MQFRSSEVLEDGQVQTKLARFDVNPSDPHVIANGPHLNLQIHMDGVSIQNLHIPIDPSTIVPGDFGLPW